MECFVIVVSAHMLVGVMASRLLTTAVSQQVSLLVSNAQVLEVLRHYKLRYITWRATRGLLPRKGVSCGSAQAHYYRSLPFGALSP